MSGDVWECYIGGTDELDRWSAEHSVVFFTDESSVFDCFLKDVMHVLLHCGVHRAADGRVRREAGEQEE